MSLKLYMIDIVKCISKISKSWGYVKMVRLSWTEKCSSASFSLLNLVIGNVDRVFYVLKMGPTKPNWK